MSMTDRARPAHESTSDGILVAHRMGEDREDRVHRIPLMHELRVAHGSQSRSICWNGCGAYVPRYACAAAGVCC